MTFDIWRTGNLIGMVTLLFFFCFYLFKEKKVSYWILAPWNYYLLSALAVFQNPYPIRYSFPVGDGKALDLTTHIDQSVGQAFSQLLLIPLVIFFVPAFKYHWKKIFLWLGVFNCLLMFQFGFGVMQASSFDAGFLAMLLPIVPLPAQILFVVTIAFTERIRTAVLIIAVQLVAVAIIKKKIGIKSFLTGIIILVAGLYFLPTQRLFYSTRFKEWPNFFNWHLENASQLIGTGTGSFQWIGPGIQKLQGKLYLQLHSDWFQLFFEGGALGLILVLIAAGHLFWKTRNNPAMFATLAGLASFMVTYHPLRFFPTALFIACAVVSIERNKTT